MLEPEEQTGISISGAVVDNTNSTGLAKSVVIVTTGKHTPTKRTNPTDDEERTYSIITNSDGSYEINNIQSGTYYIQAYSGFLAPGYFNDENKVVHVWQEADSIEAYSALNNKNVLLEPDSAYGGGEANGAVFINGGSAQPVDDVLLYAVSTTSGKVFSYNFSSDGGAFYVNDLPYGTYKLVSERVGYENAESETFEISPDQTVVSDLNLTIPVTSVEYSDAEPENYVLLQNYPNPFSKSSGVSSTTTIEYTIPSANTYSVASQPVILKVYDILGREVATLVNKAQSPGSYSVQFSAKELTSGIYIYKIQAGKFNASKKMIILR